MGAFFVEPKSSGKGSKKGHGPRESKGSITAVAATKGSRPGSLKSRVVSAIRAKKSHGGGAVTQHKSLRQSSSETPDREDEEMDLEGGDVDDLDLEASSGPESEVENSEDERETPAAKRLRLAKSYLAKVSESTLAKGEFDAADIDRDLIAERLRDDALESIGRLFTKVALKYTAEACPASSIQIRDFKSVNRGHSLSVTSVAFASASLDSPMFIYSCSKDASIIKWDFVSGQRISTFVGGIKPTKRIQKRIPLKDLNAQVGHSDEILSLAVSPDGQYLASGGKDKTVRIWSVKEDKHLTAFKHHRDTVSSLCFRKRLGDPMMEDDSAPASTGSSPQNQLYSASFDRTVKLWNVDELSYIETLFGHQDHIASVDALAKEHCMTSGSRDRTVRLWKIVEESQLIFRAGGGIVLSEEMVVMDGMRKKNDKNSELTGGSVDALCMLDEETFVSGSDAGALSLWTINRKKPLYTKANAHGPLAKSAMPGSVDHITLEVDPSVIECCWITALTALPYSDLFASGSCDGAVRLWKLADNKKSFSLINLIPMTGFINELRFFEAPCPSDNPTKNNSKALHLAVAIGQEHKFGRWWKCKRVKNGVKVIVLG